MEEGAVATRVMVVLGALAEVPARYRVELAEPEGRGAMAIRDNRVPLDQRVRLLPTIPITHRVAGLVGLEPMGEMVA